MSEFGPDYEAFRHALHAAAEQVDPAVDGLERIQARISHRRPMPWPIAWVDVALTRLTLRIPDGVWSAWDKLALQLRAASERFLPESARGLSGRLRLGWMRPVAAMSVVAFIVAAVVYMAIEVPQLASPQASISPAGHGGKGAGRTTGSSPGHSLTSGGSRSSAGPNPSSGASSHSACPTTTPMFSPAPSTSTSSQSPSQSTSPSPSTSTSTSPGSSPTPSISATGSTAPTGTGDSPDMGTSGATASDSPSSVTNAERPAGSAGRVAAGNTKPIHRKKSHQPAATPSVTCSQPTGGSAASTGSVNADAVGALLLVIGLPGITPAEVSGRTY